MVGSNDFNKSKAFYDAIMAMLGYEPGAVATRSEEPVITLLKVVLSGLESQEMVIPQTLQMAVRSALQRQIQRLRMNGMQLELLTAVRIVKTHQV